MPDADWLAWVRRAEATPTLGWLGSYELLAEIGHGAQGTVYRARQPDTRRDVVIKRLAAGSFATPSMRARFDREVEILGTLRHPHIVTVYGAERSAGQLLLAMEWVDGIPVDRWASGTDGRPREVRDILEVLCQIFDAVRHAHQRGVIHRDLKPSNVLVDREGRARVLDFGLAKLIRPDPSDALFQTAGTGFLGTPAYASPEQLRGPVDEIDVRSDVYSLGVMAYQLLAGVLPYSVATDIPALFEAILHVDPKRPSHQRSELGGEVDAIVLKALAKDIEQRYQSVDALAEDMQRYLTGQAVMAHPPSGLYRVRKFVGRHRTATAMVLALALVLVGATAISSVLYLRANEARRLAQVAQAAEFGQREIAEQSASAALQAEEEARRLAYAANIHAAESALRLDDVVSARVRLERAPEEQRGWEWFHLMGRTDRSLRRWTLPHPNHINVCVALSPDGRTLAIGASDGSVHLVDAESFEPLRDFRVAKVWVVAMVFSADGSRLYVSTGSTQAGFTRQWHLRGWDVATGEPSGPEFIGHADTAKQIMITPDGARLVSASFDRTIRVWDVTSGASLVRMNCLPEGLAAMALHPAGQWVACATSKGTVQILDGSTGTLTAEFPAKGLVSALSFSPDGTRLAVGDEDGVIRLWNWRSAGRETDLHGHTGPIRVLRFDRSDSRLISGSEDRSLRIWRLSDGREIGKCLGHTGWVTDLAVSPDDQWIYSQADESSVRAWSMVTEDIRTLDGYYGWRPVVAISPNGRLFLSGVRSAGRQIRVHAGQIVVHDTPTGAERYTIDCPIGANVVAFSPDSRHIAIGPDNDATTVGVYDALDGRRIATLGSHRASINVVAFSSDGSMLAVGAGTIRLWANLLGDPVVAADVEQNEAGVTSAAFHPDGRLLTAWNDGRLLAWDPLSKSVVNDVETGRPGGLTCLTATTNRAVVLAVGQNDKDVTLLDARNLKQVGVLAGHTSRITAIAVSPDGLRVAASDNFGAIKLWDLPTHREVATLHGHRGRVLSMTFSPDGNWLLSAAADWTVRMWQGDPGVPSH